MKEEIKVKYITASENNLEELKKIYNDFKEKYSFEVNHGCTELIIKERWGTDGIEIFPATKNGEISNSIALRPTSELEIQLFRQDENSQVFRTKDNKFIEVYYKTQ